MSTNEPDRHELARAGIYPCRHADSVNHADVFICEEAKGNCNGKITDNHRQACRYASQKQ